MAWITYYLQTKKAYMSVINEFKNTDKRVVLYGNDSWSNKFKTFFQKQGSYYCNLSFNDSEDGLNYTDLALEDISDIIVIFSDTRMFRNYEEKLISIGFSPSQFRRLNSNSIGSNLCVYDSLIGYTKESVDNLPGYVFFPPTETTANVNNFFTILTLGGSTTDPGTGNVISWSEHLYNDLVKFNKNIRVVCAGVNAHLASQELLKLVRDGHFFNPDLVISYSGVNDFSDYYHDEIHPFTLNYMKKITQDALSKNCMNGKYIWGGKPSFLDYFYKRFLKKYSFGVEAPTPMSRASHWVLCEKMMKGVSDSLGADFIGILQPQNFNDQNDAKVKLRNASYPEAISLVQAENKVWLKDFTNIFNNRDDIFYDNCHVYGHGNKIIAKKILPLVLEIMKNRGAL